MLFTLDWIYDSLRIQSHRNMYLHMFYCLGGIVFTCFFIQVASGFAMTFSNIMTDINYGWLTRSLHRWALRIVSGVPDAIPMVGSTVVDIIRGGASVGQSTLTRSLHRW